MAAFPEPASGDEVLNSWKDIAQYLSRGVRTVQRWECELALPVRRPHRGSRGAVSAVRSEIDRWLSACPTGTSENPGPRQDLNRAFRKTSDLVSESEQLRTDLVRIRLDLVLTVNRLASTVRCWQPELAK